MNEIRTQLIDYLSSLGLNASLSQTLVTIILILAIIAIGIIVDLIIRKVLLTSFERIVRKTKTDWDDLLIEHKVINSLAHLVPVLVIFKFLPVIFDYHETAVGIIERIGNILVILVSMQLLFRLLNIIKIIISRNKLFKDKPLDSYFQLIKIIFGIILGILILSILANKSIVYFFGAFGAMTAVLLLVFKDTILGFIASIQLAANDMIRIGDWIQMEKYGADGDVIEINLTTVKIRNWDKTISTVPTYSFISDSFKNWRGMQEIGSRRIARSVFINQRTVKFADSEMINRFKNIHILKSYIEEKELEIKNYNESRKIDINQVSNGRRMTNLGCFRAYLLNYLKNHPKITQDLTILVRQLEPNENGIPIQVYAFSSDIRWAMYEDIQSDIFDHILAVIHQFDLEVFQNPSGSDFKKLLN
ncbi:mechanosensitive ion channel [Flammeovirgaceae bacterium]